MNLIQTYRRLRARWQIRSLRRRQAQVNETDYASLVIKALRYTREFPN